MVETRPLLESPVWLDFSFLDYCALTCFFFFSSCILSVLFVINFNIVNISELTLAVLFLFLFSKDIVRENVMFPGVAHQAGHLGWEKESTLMWTEILGQLVFGGAGLFCSLVFKGSDSSTSLIQTREFSFTEGKDCVLSHLSPAGCGGNLTTSTGTFTSPNYPMPYYHSSECSWRLKASHGSPFLLEFEDFHLEYHPNCSQDYLAVCMKFHL